MKESKYSFCMHGSRHFRHKGGVAGFAEAISVAIEVCMGLQMR